MLQRLIGVSLGALVTSASSHLLNIGNDPQPKYVGAVVIGAIVSFFWPVFIGWYLVRRHRNKQQEQISKEVDRQVSEQTGK